MPLSILAAAGLAAGLPASAGVRSTTLKAIVGPGATISLRQQDGTTVRSLDPGAYTIAVDDKSEEHNFHLFGAGVDQSTPVETIGTTTWDVTFQDGETYKFHCDAHVSTMRGSFTVGTVVTPPAPPRLNAKVSARTISLTAASGARVRVLAQNTYRVVVSDTTKAQNFHLTGPGVNRKTRVAAKATTTWTLAFSPGRYVYRSDKNRKLLRSFTVKGPPPVP